MQDAFLRLESVEVQWQRPRLRCNTGRPRAVKGDYLGVDVNIAARLAQKARPDELLVCDVALAGIDPEQINARWKKALLFTAVKGVPPGMVVYAGVTAPSPGTTSPVS